MPVRISAELLEVLSLCDTWRDRTHGALDPAAEAVTRAWKTAASRGRVPAAAELAAAVDSVNRVHWTLDLAAVTATRTSDTPLVLASFAKSFIAGKAAAAALAAGATAAVVNIGGDIVVRGDWTEPVNVANSRDDAENAAPMARLLVADRAVATSGDYRRGADIAGVHYSHIVDPRTGRTADEVISATVVARDPSEAGALATALSVLGVEAGRRLAESRGAEFLMVKRDGTRVVSSAAYFAAANVPDSGAELSISLQRAQADSARYRRPFVAVWVEDKDRFPVRTIALWFDKPRWLPDLKAWNHSDRLRALAEGADITASIASATRPPGKYALKWDGKDNAGKPVKPGKYTVFIEASREHGTYQLLKQEIDFGGAPRQIQLPAGTEISAASLDYHKSAR